MRVLLIIIMAVFFSIESFCQPIYTTDLVFLGYREDFFSNCMEDTKDKYLNVYNHIINKYYYCTCTCDELIPRLSSKEVIEAIENESLYTLFLKRKYYKIVEPCIKHYAVIKDVYSENSKNKPDEVKKIYVQMCIDGFSHDSVTYAMITEQKIREYCECLVTEILDRGYNYAQFYEFEKEESEAFNEIMLPCHDEVFGYLKLNNSNIGYVPEDILGDDSYSKISLTEYIGQGYKLKISINGIANYYLFDTGASTLLITNDMEHELIISGAIAESDYKGYEYFELANKKIEKARIVVLNNVTIGDYTVNNVKAAIVEDGSLLCGNSLLNKFRKWELDSENKCLILYK